MIAVVRAEDRVIGRHTEAMRPFEDALAPGAEECPIAVEHRDGMGAPAEHIDLVAGINGHGGNFMKVPAIGKSRPVGNQAIPEVPAAEGRFESP